MRRSFSLIKTTWAETLMAEGIIRLSNKRNFGNCMNIIMRYSGISKRAMWLELVEKQISRLQNLAAIATARVTLEWQRGVKPAFRVLTFLEVPGPDFHAEARDHTVPAALIKVVKNLERQIRSRHNRRADKRKTNLQLGLSPGRSSSGLVDSRA
jgi:ribosome-associated translation inhibitor RaiA